MKIKVEFSSFDESFYWIEIEKKDEERVKEKTSSQRANHKRDRWAHGELIAGNKKISPVRTKTKTKKQTDTWSGCEEKPSNVSQFYLFGCEIRDVIFSRRAE